MWQFLIISLLFPISNHAFQLNFVFVTIGDNPSYGYYAAAPYFDQSFILATQMFPNVFTNATRQIFHKPGLPACPDAAAAMFAVTGEICDVVDRMDGFTVLLSPGCSPELMPLGDLAREMNVPLLASTSTDPMFANAKRYPTMLTFGPAGQGAHSQALRAILKHYRWRTITLFCDDLLKYTSIAAFLATNCRAMRALLTVPGEFEFYLESYDSKDNPDYEARLLRARSQSRILVLLTRADEIRKIMMTAHKLNMTNDEFIFLHTIAVQGPEYLPLEVDMDDGNDEVIFKAYQYLITMSFHIPNYTRLSPFINAAANIARDKYAHPYSFDEKNNEMTLAIPELLYCVGKVLNETDIPLSDMTTAQFRRLFVNQTFDTGIRRVRIGPNGMRMADTIFRRLKKTSRKFEPAWYYDFPAKLLTNTSDLATDWNGRFLPPLNVPVCGYRYDRCQSRDDLLPIILGVVCGVVGVCGLFLLLAIIIMKKYASHGDTTSWWHLEAQHLHDKKDIPVTGTQTADDSELAIAKYRNDTVLLRSCNTTISQSEILGMKPLKKLLAQIRLARHDKIGQFFGLIQTVGRTSIVWEGGRGTLRALFATNDAITSDVSIQLYFVFNILDGLNYIHNSTVLRVHGSLSSLTVILDSRFTAKLCDVASNKLLQYLAKNFSSTEKICDDVLKAPEYSNNHTFNGSREADIYAVGALMYEIFRAAPLCSSDSLQIGNLKFGNHSLQSTVQGTITSCCSTDPTHRPKIREVLSRMSSYRPRGTIVGSLIDRLEKHAEHLETTVELRTEELMMERRKVDTLLGEIIPPSLVSKLRNKIIIPAETFDMVTLLFTSMVGFDTFCAASQPLEVGVFLNDLYSLIDSLLVTFDVYKVETIKDIYLVASGVPIRNGNRHVTEIASLASRLLKNCIPANLRRHLPIKIGIHSGPVAAGFVGSKLPRYCLFGDTMNTASRMESYGEASRIHISEETKQLLDVKNQYHIVSRGQIDIKGKGLTSTYWLDF